MNIELYLPVGFYANIFPIYFNHDTIDIMIIERKNLPALKNLRNEIERNKKEIYLYAPPESKKVYGYGKEKEWLLSKGFKKLEKFNIYEEPRLTGRAILEGILKRSENFGYEPLKSKDKGRWFIYNWKEYHLTTDKKVKVIRGYDLRVIFLWDSQQNILKFNLIIDVRYSYRDTNNMPLHPQQIVKYFGNKTLKEVRQIQKDLIPTGRNPEVARQRLLEEIIPFVKRLNTFELPIGITAKVSYLPVRVIAQKEEQYDFIR